MSPAAGRGLRDMGKVIYFMNVSLDGFVADRDGNLDWSEPDEELHRFFNDQTREAAVELYGRRLYEIMRYWETEDASAPDYEREFGRLWRETPRYVVSSTLERAEGGAELVRGDLAEAVEALKARGDVAAGGPGLAASLFALGLVDEVRMLVHPVLLGGGTPFFPGVAERIPLRLLETRTIGSGVAYLRYETA